MRVAVSCALFGVGACNTYSADLLTPSQSSSTSAGGTATGGSNPTVVGGSSNGGASGVAGGVVIASGSVGNAGAAGADISSNDAGTGASGVGGSAASGAGGHAGSTSTAGGGGSAGSNVAGATSGASGGPNLELIDDFEDQDLVLLLTSKRNGPWYPFKDATKTGVQTFGIALIGGTADARPGSSSTASLHMKATGFTVWGAGLGADFVNSAAVKAPYDVSAYSGIRFYAKIGSGTQPAAKMLIPTTYSDPMGGKCDDAVTGMHCSDHLYCPINSLKSTWAVYECDFSALVQQGFGLPQKTLDPTSVYSVQFTLGTTPLAADFWLDEIAFVLK